MLLCSEKKKKKKNHDQKRKNSAVSDTQKHPFRRRSPLTKNKDGGKRESPQKEKKEITVRWKEKMLCAAVLRAEKKGEASFPEKKEGIEKKNEEWPKPATHGRLPLSPEKRGRPLFELGGEKKETPRGERTGKRGATLTNRLKGTKKKGPSGKEKEGQ